MASRSDKLGAKPAQNILKDIQKVLSQSCRKAKINDLCDFSKILATRCRNVVARDFKMCRKLVAPIKSNSYENNDKTTKTIKDILATPPHMSLDMWGVANVAWRGK